MVGEQCTALATPGEEHEEADETKSGIGEMLYTILLGVHKQKL
jgi:hypothetical protein